MKPAYLSILLILILCAACNPVSPTQIVPSSNPTPTGSSIPLLIWHRTGGFAGFCDELIVYPTGSVNVSSCKGLETALSLTETQREQLDGWVNSLRTIDYTSSDPAVADAMTISLFLAGIGTQAADEETIHLISRFAADLQAQAIISQQAPPEKDEAEQTLRAYLSALNAGDYILAANLYGGEMELLKANNPDIPNSLPSLLERACTQNGWVCLMPRTVTYRGPDSVGGFQFFVEFTNPDGSLFRQGPCCGDESGASVTSFLFRVVKTESGYAVIDLPPYVP